ncbi:hypothetical protein AURDEDRAFT_113397, partial [Auricularia subglabra TFB-10046 SS5]
MTDSKKLKFHIPMSSVLFNTTTTLRAPVQAPAPQQYNAWPSTLGQQIAPPVLQPTGSTRGGSSARPAHMTHQARRSRSMMPLNSVVEDSEIQVTALTMMPQRGQPVSAHPNQNGPPAVSSSFGGSGHASHMTMSHSHSASLASTRTFGHGAAPPPVASRRSVESDQSLGSSTGDVSV